MVTSTRTQNTVVKKPRHDTNKPPSSTSLAVCETSLKVVKKQTSFQDQPKKKTFGLPANIGVYPLNVLESKVSKRDLTENTVVKKPRHDTNKPPSSTSLAVCETSLKVVKKQTSFQEQPKKKTFGLPANIGVYPLNVLESKVSKRDLTENTVVKKPRHDTNKPPSSTSLAVCETSLKVVKKQTSFQDQPKKKTFGLPANIGVYPLNVLESKVSKRDLTENTVVKKPRHDTNKPPSSTSLAVCETSLKVVKKQTSFQEQPKKKTFGLPANIGVYPLNVLESKVSKRDLTENTVVKKPRHDTNKPPSSTSLAVCETSLKVVKKQTSFQDQPKKKTFGLPANIGVYPLNVLESKVSKRDLTENTVVKKPRHDTNKPPSSTSLAVCETSLKVVKKQTSFQEQPKKKTFGLPANIGVYPLNVLESKVSKRDLTENTVVKKPRHDTNKPPSSTSLAVCETSLKVVKKQTSFQDQPKKKTFGLPANIGVYPLNVLESKVSKQDLTENTVVKKPRHDTNKPPSSTSLAVCETSLKVVKKQTSFQDQPKKKTFGLPANIGVYPLNVLESKVSKRDLTENTVVKKPRHDTNKPPSSTSLAVCETSLKVVKKQTSFQDQPKKKTFGLPANIGVYPLNVLESKVSKRDLTENGPREMQHDDKQYRPRDFPSFHEKTTYGLAVSIGLSWCKVLEPEFLKQYFIKLSKFIQSERESGTVYPPPEEVLGFTQSIKLENIKVVIIGQAPYPDPFLAHGRHYLTQERNKLSIHIEMFTGLAFSTKKGIPIPPTLQNICKEVGLENPEHGDLQGWADQGVLLLNVCLTVRAYKSNSHKGHGWEKFTNAIVSWLSENCRGLVFMLWGCYSKRKEYLIDKTKHHILMTSLPAPHSAKRGFLGCSHFYICNQLLKKEGKETINWFHLP